MAKPREKRKRLPSCKRQVREAFNSSGVDAAVKLGYECSTSQSRLTRWIKQWTNGAVTEIIAAPVRVSDRARRVKIFENWYGAVVEEGPEQSGVRITRCPHDTMTGSVQYYPNKWLKPLARREVGGH
jgi:hypothetical protein